MHGKKLHDFLFSMYDYADFIADQIRPGNYDNGINFNTIVDVERFFDAKGRSEMTRAINEASTEGFDLEKSSVEVNIRLDKLRKKIASLKNSFDFDETLNSASKRLAFEWHRKPKHIEFREAQ